mmetsp:Transcript_41512/g.81109  ORF Transcript_41512/g.81109 Transcript_41512/m.81109 type:complete len:262 (+) Transcript_41512:130-915(+)
MRASTACCCASLSLRAFLRSSLSNLRAAISSSEASRTAVSPLATISLRDSCIIWNSSAVSDDVPPLSTLSSICSNISLRLCARFSSSVVGALSLPALARLRFRGSSSLAGAPPPDLAAGAFLTHLPASSSSSERAMRRSTTTAPPANATLPPTIAPPPLRLAIFLTAKRALSYVSVSASVVSWTLSSMNQAALEARSDRLTGLGWTFCAAWTPDADMSTEAAAARDAAFLRHALCCFSSCLPSSPPPISPTPSLPCASPPS